jgi:hypothetical protein
MFTKSVWMLGCWRGNAAPKRRLSTGAAQAMLYLLPRRMISASRRRAARSDQRREYVLIYGAERAGSTCVSAGQHGACWRLDNCYRDHAVVNARQLTDLLSAEHPTLVVRQD